MPSECVEVLYDYNYETAEGKHVTINKGDRYKLLARSTEEWWKVLKGDREKLYVPANYVRVLSNDLENSSRYQSDDKTTISIRTDIPDELDSLPKLADSHTNGWTISTSGTKSNVSKRNTLNLDLKNSLPITSSDPSPSTPDNQHEPVQYANMQIIQNIIAQRHLHSNVDGIEDAWEMHTDDESGKIYYYNSVTQKTTWDSPVFNHKMSKTYVDRLLPELEEDKKRVSRVSSIRKGWTETTNDDRTKTYVHNATGEKWHMAVDSSGKEYYYKENSQESLWELPEMEDWPLAPTVTNMDRLMGHPSNLVYSESSASKLKEEMVTRPDPPVPMLRRPSTDTIVIKTRSLPLNFKLTNTCLSPDSSSYTAAADLIHVKHRANSEKTTLSGGYAMRNVVQSSSSFDQQKQGYLNKTKVCDGKKKVKKNWLMAYVVADECNLLIYKDEKAALSNAESEYGQPEALLDLRSATVCWSTKERSTRKNVIEVTSASGTCYLFQSEDNILIHQWFTVILGKVRKFNQSVITEDLSSPVPEDNNNTDKLNSNAKLRKHSRRFSRHGAAKSVYTLHEDNEEFLAPDLQNPAGEVMKMSIKEKLKSFLTRRPTQESLEKAGIIQAERVFGSRLQFICNREQNTVPNFVVKCIKTIEDKGVDFDGLYRINGNQAQIQKLRFAVDSSDDYNLSSYDVHVLTGALKLFFRELKEPLVPFELYHVLSDIIRDKDRARRDRAMKLQLSTMPTVNLQTLKLLFDHLARVHEKCEKNRMKAQNIAIVFGPTLMWPEKESSAIAASMMCQNSIVEYILINYNKLF